MSKRYGRLILGLYIGSFVLVFVLGGLYLAALAASQFARSDLQKIAKHVVRSVTQDLDPAALRSQVDSVDGTPLKMSIYSAAGVLLATTVSPPLPFDTGRSDLFVYPVTREQNVVAYAICSPGIPPLKGIWALLILVGVLVAMVVAISSHLGAPMQRIAEAAHRFGRGDLSARAGLTRRDELGDVGRAFDEMAERVTLLISAQRELMANVSHELQTPLARVQVAVDLVLDGVSDKVKELLPEISEDLAEVERLIEDVMTLSRFDLAHAEGRSISAPLRLEHVAIEEVVEWAASRFRGQHPGRALQLRAAPELPVLHLDPMLIRRVIDNLLENARKYSESDTEIVIAVAVDGDHVRIQICDRGIGIDAADLQRMFTPFFRTDRSRSRTTGGVGLGLVLARRIVEAHEGSISIESTPQSGTAVTVLLPTRAGEKPLRS